MTTNSGTVAGEGGPDIASRRVPGRQPNVRSRKPSRARSLLSTVLKRSRPQAKTVMVCDLCEMTGGPFAPDEAALLLTVHNQLHHGGVSMHRPPLPPVS